MEHSDKNAVKNGSDLGGVDQKKGLVNACQILLEGDQIRNGKS